MRTAKLRLSVLVVLLLGLFCGCEKPRPVLQDQKTIQSQQEESPVEDFLSQYYPQSIKVTPLTGYAVSDEQTALKVYLKLLDSAGLALRAPGVFRFELYEHINKSGVLKGKRVAIWDDFDLNQNSENLKYWQDFIRSYEFILPFKYPTEKKYVLEITCITADKKRIYTRVNLTESPK